MDCRRLLLSLRQPGQTHPASPTIVISLSNVSQQLAWKQSWHMSHERWRLSTSSRQTTQLTFMGLLEFTAGFAWNRSTFVVDLVAGPLRLVAVDNDDEAPDLAPDLAAFATLGQLRTSSHAWHRNRSPTVLWTVLSFLLSGQRPSSGLPWHLICLKFNCYVPLSKVSKILANTGKQNDFNTNFLKYSCLL